MFDTMMHSVLTYSCSAIGLICVLLGGWIPGGFADEPGFEISRPTTYRLKIVMRVEAEGRPLSRVTATCPLPVDWREQKVKLLSETKPDRCKTRERSVEGMGGLWVLDCPKLSPGQIIEAERIYQITRFQVVCQLDLKQLNRPQAVALELRNYLSDSPGIETGDADLKELAEKIAGSEKSPAEFAKAAADWVRGHVQYQPGGYRGAKFAFEHHRGDCEDMSALLIALCRINKIPARTVWVEGHAYSELYLEGGGKRGYWIPVELTRPQAFGRIREMQPILQKGDQYRDPATRQPIRYLPQQAIAYRSRAKLKVTRTILRDQSAGTR